jgi:hypothetical protein
MVSLWARHDGNWVAAESWPRQSFVVRQLVRPSKKLPDAISRTSDAVGGVSLWNKN